ncbi:cysteine hydrolase family protein [Nocardia cyriacigeorgica]|uniref:cysteine hydrolase family protein n=1 Tax=Nocardia cyriacigeorgica TaxID=135487 RepID=UPI0018956C0D|nr:isochorismatase family cysteine hydrolase [Nocardia cyriacigeorgica]MBF6439555.1 cysteine hydrolase [Nocardia cyriacigeorgica]
MTTVVLMIDLQNGYLRQDVRDALGWPPIWRLTEVLDECRLLLRAARDAGLPVIFSRQVPSSAGSLAINPRAGRQLAARQARLPKLTVDDQRWRTQIMDAVAPVDGDIVLDKTRPSFFTHTELDPILRSLGAQRLIVAGLQTNVCVEATARAGLDHNFEVAVAEDAVTTDGPALHYASLNALRVLYVEVAPWQELLAPDAPWDRAYTTPNYGRDTSYWDENHASTPPDAKRARTLNSGY